MIVQLLKGKGNGTECRNYRGISMLGVVGKIYEGMLVDIVHRVTEGLTDGCQGGFRGRGDV